MYKYFILRAITINDTIITNPDSVVISLETKIAFLWEQAKNTHGSKEKDDGDCGQCDGGFLLFPQKLLPLIVLNQKNHI